MLFSSLMNTKKNIELKDNELEPGEKLEVLKRK